MPAAQIRIACTVPPAEWFGGRDYFGAQVVIDVLERMGISVFRVDTRPFVEKNTVGCWQVITELRSFAPDFAFSLPNSGYGLGCTVVENGKQHNIFTEILEIPLAVAWDDPLGQFARCALSPYPDSAQASVAGALATIRSVVNNPLMTHFAWDSGHVTAIDELGILPRQRIYHGPLYATSPYLDHGKATSPATSFRHSLSFAGNVYTAATIQHPLYQLDVVRSAFQAMAGWRDSDIATPAWRLFERYIAGISATERQLNGFSPDNPFFWYVYEYLVWVAINTYSRMRVLESLDHEVAFFGGFADPDGVASLRMSRKIDYSGVVDYVTELPEVFRTTCITVDITNQLAQNSAPGKLYECFAAGGFMLFDRKPDIIDAFGDIAEKISYKSTEELNTKIEYYLTHDNERADISRSMKNKIAECYTVEKWVERIVRGMGFELMKNNPLSFALRPECNVSDELYAGKALFENCSMLAAERPRLRRMHDALRRQMKIGHPGDLPFHEWTQLMAFAYNFKPDLILEIGRGYGNSTCVFTHVANMLAPAPCRVVSICLSDWQGIKAKLSEVGDPGWFDLLELHQCNILSYDYASTLRNAKRILVFWDAHGYDVAECVLGRVLPLVHHKENVIVMHDIADARYKPQTSLYGTFPLWTEGDGNNSPACHIRLGNLYSAVEQAVAIYDFSSRNDIELFTAAHSLHAFFGKENDKYKEVMELLHDDMFSLDAGWLWFSLDKNNNYTFPATVFTDIEEMRQTNNLSCINDQIAQMLGIEHAVSDDELKEASDYIALAVNSANMYEYLKNTAGIPRSTKPLLSQMMRYYYNNEKKEQFELLKSLYDLMK